MTSSFRQRDPYAIGSTNYLATGADLSDAMIKEQDALIKDTQSSTNKWQNSKNKEPKDHQGSR